MHDGASDIMVMQTLVVHFLITSISVDLESRIELEMQAEMILGNPQPVGLTGSLLGHRLIY